MIKICRLINERFSWILAVDGQEIPFQGGHNVDYFKNHYEKLGYTVEVVYSQYH